MGRKKRSKKGFETPVSQGAMSSETGGEETLAPLSWKLVGLLVLAVVVVTLNALRSPFLLDDVTKIIENTDLRTLANIPGRLVYPYHEFQVIQRNDPSRPLVFLIYTLLYAISGPNPLWFHIVGAFFHAAATVLTYFLLARVTRALALSVNLAFFGALLFAVAPIQIGTVTYAYGLSDVASGALMLLSLVWALRRFSPSRGDWIGSLAAFVLALACKQSAIIVPALLMLIDFLESRPFEWKRYIPHSVVAVLYLLFRFLYFGGMGDLEGYSNPHPWGEYVTCEPWVWVLYLVKSLVPRHLAIDHFLMPFHIGWGQRVAGGVFWLAVVAVGVMAWKRRERPAARLLAGVIAWYVISLAPTGSLLPTVDLMVERRVYLANVVFYVLVAWGLYALTRKLKLSRSVGVGLLSVYVAGNALVSLHRNEVYSTPESAWENVLTIYPTSQRALNSLANINMAKGEFEKATVLYEKVISIDPNDYVARGNFGALLESEANPKRDVGRALMMFQESARINPAIAENHYNIARILQMQGRLAEAVPLYQKTLELKPDYAPAYNNLAAIQLAWGLVDTAEPLLRRALQIDPFYTPAKENLALIARIRAGKK